MKTEPTDRTCELGARAATQRGETEDKIPGFDPSAAPMETDAEAGGGAYGGPAGATGTTGSRPSGTSTAPAMRPVLHARTGVRLGLGIFLTLLAAFSVAIGLGYFLLAN